MVNQKPNIIFVLTDDQGYGDLGCTGNPWIKTPNIDKFYNQSVRFTDYHVSPLCAPTRGGLMTGTRPLRNGVWATAWGRSILKEGFPTLAEVLTFNGYETGMFGKWHLGDNYPSRPQDRGFSTVVAHKGGGIGQTPDFWGNNYFDDTYFNNGIPKSYEGYCTDIWFDEAMRFIEENKDKPFFAYISTNAPHTPYLVADKYAEQYRGNLDIVEPEFYGMITNIDENFGKLREKLRELELEDNTILIFMTDNGSSGGSILDEDQYVKAGYNANMRGKKASYYEGGHRVPFFIRWPNGNIDVAKDIDQLVTNIDFMPTIMEMCNLKYDKPLNLDGESAFPLLKGESKSDDKIDFLQYRQSTQKPEKWTNAVMHGKWRLIGGKELYNIKDDPGQKNDLSTQYPKIVEKLRIEHETWWKEVSDDLDIYSSIHIGNEKENPMRIDAMDVMGDMIYRQTFVAMAQKSLGKWWINVEKTGKYKFELARWPKEVMLSMDEVIADESFERLTHYSQIVHNSQNIVPKNLKVTKGQIRIFNIDETVEVQAGEDNVEFILDIQNIGETCLECYLFDHDEKYGSYYVYITKLKDI